MVTESIGFLIEKHHVIIGLLFIAVFTWVAFWYQLRQSREQRRMDAMAAEVDNYDAEEPHGM